MKKTAIKSVKDIASGAIITTEKGHEYVLIRDDAGVPSMYAKDGRFVRLNQDGLCDIKGKHKFAKVSAFLTMPQADQISEAFKYLYTGREACAELTTIYKVENEEVKQAKERLKNVDIMLSRLNTELEDIFTTLEDNGVDVERLIVENHLKSIAEMSCDECDCDDCDEDYDDDDDEWED